MEEEVEELQNQSASNGDPDSDRDKSIPIEDIPLEERV
jgi:hypothetical protein